MTFGHSFAINGKERNVEATFLENFGRLNHQGETEIMASSIKCSRSRSCDLVGHRTKFRK